MLENDLGASLLFVFVFLSVVFALPLLLAWLERPHQARGLHLAVRRVTRPWRARVRGVRDEVRPPPVSTTGGSPDL